MVVLVLAGGVAAACNSSAVGSNSTWFLALSTPIELGKWPLQRYYWPDH